MPKKKRQWRDPYLPGQIIDAHCFEVSEIYTLAYQLALDVWRIADGPLTSFLPAPKTWLEFGNKNGRRAGLLLEQETGNSTVKCWDVWPTTKSDRFEALASGNPKLHPDEEIYQVHDIFTFDLRIGPDYAPFSTKERAIEMLDFIPAFLFCINSPKIIGRRQRMPHRGLERDLTRSGAVGKFPLQAWTEIKLEVFKPIEIDDGEPHEAHLTGRRALHFCRAHIRIRNGQLEFVQSHWRGDPALGMKRARYRAVPAKNL